MTMRTWIEISEDKFIQNCKQIKQLLRAGTVFAPCIKANGYGHGLAEIIKIIQRNKISDWVCVQSVAETKVIRNSGFGGNILCISAVFPFELKELINLNASFNIYSSSVLKELIRLINDGEILIPAKIHIMVDTGMSWQGVNIGEIDTFLNLIAELKVDKKHLLVLEGLNSHFASSDDKHPGQFNEQLTKFIDLKKNLSARNIIFKYYSIANSAGIIRSKNCHFNFVQPGIVLYGLFPSQECRDWNKNIDLSPILTFKTRIAFIKWIKKGQLVGYGGSFKTEKDTKIAILPTGYFDGIPRNLGGPKSGSVFINNIKCPIIGRICMNTMIIDVTNGGKMSEGDIVEIFNKQNIDESATLCGTINYEITTRINPDIKRVLS